MWPRTAFGDYLRAEVGRQGGDTRSRQALQDLGQSRVDADPVAFCRDVLAFGGFGTGMNFVLDGVRHVKIFDIVAGIVAPSNVRLVFLYAAEASRATRVGKRDDASDLSRAERHPVEAETVEALPDRADARIDADRSLEAVVADCVELARSWSTQV